MYQIGVAYRLFLNIVFRNSELLGHCFHYEHIITSFIATHTSGLLCIYINLRRSRDCLSVAVWICLCHRAASFTYFGEVLRCPHKRIVTITKVYIARNNIHVELNYDSVKNSDFIDIKNFEVGIRPYSFATAVFTKLGSMLSGTSRHCSVLVAPDVSGHDHFGT